MIVYIFFLCIQLAFALAIFFLTLAFLTGAPFVPSTSEVTTAMIRLANIKKGQIIYDLGSGDGRLLFAAAKEGATAIGYEINPYLVLYTILKQIITPYGHHITVRWRNFWSAPLSDASVVFVYLLPWRMHTLEQKLKRELKPGTIIVSNSFIFNNWEITKKDEKHHVYLFTVT